MPSESFVTFSEMQIIAYCCKKNQVIGLISTHLVFGHKKECSVAQSFIHVENILWNNHQRSNCAKSLFSGFRLLYFKRRSIEKIIKECAAELSASSLCVIQGLLPGGWMPITPTVCFGMPASGSTAHTENRLWNHGRSTFSGSHSPVYTNLALRANCIFPSDIGLH